MAWTSPRTWVAGETVTAALLNAHLRDNLKSIGDPWTAYTPTMTWTGSSWTWTCVGRYIMVGKLVIFGARCTISGGSAGAPSGAHTISLPVAMRNTDNVTQLDMTARFVSAGVGWYLAGTLPASGTAVTVGYIGSNGGISSANSTTPFTWKSSGGGDQVFLAGTYESA